jgi:ABC-2 type transport system permease protein
MLVILALATLIAFAFGALGAFFALRTGSGESVQGLFPILFVGLFLSSMNLPRNLIETDWFRIVATFNPVSYLIESVRSLIIEGWNPQALVLGFGFATLIAALSIAASAWALRGRLTRT